MVDGLHLFQFRKRSDPTCCTPTTALPPHVPAPELSPGKQIYLPFK